MRRTTIDFGIDLGTTNSTIAVIDGVDAKVIPNQAGSGITPSAVWIDERGTTRVGFEAKERALVSDHDNADVEFKLRMGRGPESKKVFARSGREMSPEELSAEVLKSLKTDVRTALGEEVRAAVITVPAAFENPATTATLRAAKLAGFSQCELVLEPVAASLAYGFQSERENVYWLVYDFGGGTFDAAVMRIRDGLIQVANHDGNNFLGGKLIDWDIVTKKLVPALTDAHDLDDLRRGNTRWRNELGKMKFYAERAKIDVCRTRQPAEIWIQNACVNRQGRSVDLSYTLTPEDVAEVSQPYIEQSLSLCRNTLKQLGLTGKDLDRVLMVGGSTLNPWVREAVQQEIGQQVEFGIDPVTVVARGAAIFASMRNREIDEVQDPTQHAAWRIKIEHEPVGNVPDPDIGGRVISPNGQSVEGFTVQFYDESSPWRSGTIRLGSSGVFMTQLEAQKQRRHVYRIELCDPQGSPIACSPDRVSYTIGVVPEAPPATFTIGVGTATGSVDVFIAKGQKLPAREDRDHYSTVAVRAGHAEDELRIPVLEGQHERAERNHYIGAIVIRGSDIHRDLPAMSPIDIIMHMDTSQQINVQVYVPHLDRDFPGEFNPVSGFKGLDSLRGDAAAQRARLTKLRQQVQTTPSSEGRAALARFDQQMLLEQVESLLEAAEGDPDALMELDRHLRTLSALLDDVADTIELPLLLNDAADARKWATAVVEGHGEAADRKLLAGLIEEIGRATAASDTELLRRHIDDLNNLAIRVSSRTVAFHVESFEWLEARMQALGHPGQSRQLIAQGRRSINNDDVEGLKAANRQLFSLLPRDTTLPPGINEGGSNPFGPPARV